MLKIIRYAVRPELLPSALPAKLLGIVYDYFDSYKAAPGEHFHDEIVRWLASSGRGDEYRVQASEYLKRLEGLRPNPEYVLSSVSDFVRARELEGAVGKFQALVQAGRFDEAQNLMYAALRSGIDSQDAGLDYASASSSAELPAPFMSTGIEQLDRLVGGYYRGNFVCFLGGYKGMKTWSLQHAAKAAVTAGLKVLYVSHEVTERQLVERFDMLFGALASKGLQPGPGGTVPVELRTWDEAGGKFGAERVLRPSVRDPAAVRRVRGRVRRFGGRLLLRKYPMGSASMLEVNRYLAYLESFKDFVPDVLINDYADIMAPVGDRDELRHVLNETYIWHKRIADERNILVLTASQARREAIGRATISLKDFAEDIRKAANIDVGIAICRTPEQAESEEASLYVIANRDGAQDVGCVIGTKLCIGQFCTYSRPYRAIIDKEISA